MNASTRKATTGRDMLQSAERRYKRQGYRVLLHPRGDALPHFLRDFEPDMIAYNDQESVVVEIKQRMDLPASGYLMDLADAVGAQQGWRLDLAVLETSAATLVDEDLENLGQPEIVARIRATRQIVQGQQEEEAILLAWCTVEAALRLIAARQHISLQSDQPGYAVKQLYSLGIMDREEYTVLQRGVRARNILMHGFRLPEPEPNLAETLVSTVEDLLQTGATTVAI